MNKDQNTPVRLLSIGGVLLISSLILGEFFAQMIPFGGYIFIFFSLLGIYFLYLGVKKNIQQVLQNRE
jgi:hypothetical protein